ncbi:MAG: hypothetical protein FJ387_05065 [Verrucomicrobia bacterium]|nr:hypothetical protein [Verrucomicrobiota bacterium]
MSVIELIRHVAAIPPGERTLFEQLLRAMESSHLSPDLASQSPWPDFAARLRSIYGQNLAPDLTLLAYRLTW